MLEKTTPIRVLNRDNGSVVYSIPEMNGLRRVFGYGETKEVTFQELQKLSYLPGGKELLSQSLVILDNPEAISQLIGSVEPEYSYTRNDIIKLMQQGSLDEFLDCLDFAPEGVTDMIKTLSVSLPLNDVRKREAILNKLGFDVDSAVRIQKETAVPDQEKHPTQRRVHKDGDGTTKSGRRIVKKTL